VLSKGHASASLYATLAEAGFIPTEQLEGEWVLFFDEVCK
jgi:transketolase N-terminal domain/subunit